ncbi:MAG: septal ring lytic transglycosylase RlpA family protein [Oceanicaulis sp.]|nr:septal ring lytic transglycosylase RlpA family protein [Oceanicaulis sp.]
MWTPSPPPALVEVNGARLPVQATEEGTASWYGARFHGRLTANGEIFDKHALTAAHLTMDLPSLARVTRLDTGASVIVRVNDRGPYIEGRVIDLSRAAAEALDFVDEGLAEVRIEALGPADAHDRAAVSRIVRGPGARTAAQR